MLVCAGPILRPGDLIIVLFMKLSYIPSFIQQIFVEYNMSGIKQWSVYHLYEATVMSLLMSQIFFRIFAHSNQEKI